MSSISSISCSTLASYASVKNTQKSDTSSLADKLFEKLDTKQQGYVDKSELQAALTSSASGKTSDSSTSADDLFTKIDADGDGKITKQELGNGLQSLMDQVESMAAKMRVQGGGKGEQPGGGEDKGFSKDELVQMAQDTSETDSKRSTFMSKIAENFDKADSDGNGKVTRDEAMSYAQSTGEEMGGPSGPQGAGGPSGSAPPPPPGGGAPAGESSESTAEASSSESTEPADTNGDGTVSAKEALAYLLEQLGSDTSSATSATADTSTSDKSGFNDKIAKQIIQLIQAYGSNTTAANDSSSASSLSVSA